jgi:predicted CXXCH cytochrome family protein
MRAMPLIKAHEGQLLGADCVTCHDPHQSSRPKLMQAFVHPPFGEKLCDVCHQPAKNGKVVLTQASVKELCVGCHSDQADKIEKSKFQHPGAQGDCTDCHNPHAGKSAGFPLDSDRMPTVIDQRTRIKGLAPAG